MLLLNIRNGKHTFHFCCVCGGKVPPSHQQHSNLRLIRMTNIPQSHYRCYGTKVIRGYSNGDRCTVAYRNTSSRRHEKHVIGRANSLNRSLVAYLVNTIKRVATVDYGGGIFYIMQSQPVSDNGAIHTSSPPLDLRSTEESNDNVVKSSSPSSQTILSASRTHVWMSVKVRGKNMTVRLHKKSTLNNTKLKCLRNVKLQMICL